MDQHRGIQGNEFGGGNGSGDRFAIGTTASEDWHGMVQVFDYDIHTQAWVRIGQPVVGKRTLERWGGQVELSVDGSTLVVSFRDGGSNRVAAYRLGPVVGLKKEPNQRIWGQVGQLLHGTDNDHEYFGADLDINYDGSILAIGAPGDFELNEMK